LAATVPRMRARTPALPGKCPANPRPGDALVSERGARRATGSHANPNHWQPRSPGCGRGRPRSQGSALPIPDLEMRSSSSAEPAGRRGAMQTPTVGRHGPPDAGEDARAPREVPCQSQTWRCARPRARSPKGEGEPCLSPAAAQTNPKRARRPRSQGGPAPLQGLESRSTNTLSLAPSRYQGQEIERKRRNPSRASSDVHLDPHLGSAPRGSHRRTNNALYQNPPRRETGCGRGRNRLARGSSQRDGTGLRVRSIGFPRKPLMPS
jgi:hypothetical protein